MEKIFRGVLNYRHKWKDNMVQQFKQVRDNPSPSAVFMTCVDTRMLPTRFTQTHVGDMFISRNVGNIMPHSSHFDPLNPSPEPGVLELGCAVNHIGHVIVCGHSDCKAMNLLHSMREEACSVNLIEMGHTPIRAWLLKHGMSSLKKFEDLEKHDFKKPMMVSTESSSHFPAYIDVEHKLDPTDKLSQVNTLVQMENIASYPFMTDCIRDGSTHIHAMWFDIFTGEVHYFSKKQKCFVPILEENVDVLLSDFNNEDSKGPNLDQKAGKDLIQDAKNVFKKGSHNENGSKCC